MFLANLLIYDHHQTATSGIKRFALERQTNDKLLKKADSDKAFVTHKFLMASFWIQELNRLKTKTALKQTDADHGDIHLHI